jgi:hypothetical protein
MSCARATCRGFNRCTVANYGDAIRENKGQFIRWIICGLGHRPAFCISHPLAYIARVPRRPVTSRWCW